MKILLIILSVLLFHASNAKVGNLSPNELLTAQKSGTVIIDIRTPEEWSDIGTVPNSARIMFFDQKRKPLVAEFMLEFEKIVTNKDQPFILVCRTGSRTGVVTKFLDGKLGYTQASHLEKGMKNWISEKHEVEK